MDNNAFKAVDAIKYLKKGIILYAYIEKNINYFKYKDNMVYVFSSNSSYYLKEDEFLEIYALSSFCEYKDNEDIIDIERDNEYYKMDKLRK